MKNVISQLNMLHQAIITLLSVIMLLAVFGCDDDSHQVEIDHIYLSGTLAADTTIHPNSCLHINEALIVPAGITLTLEENVELDCSSGVVLRIRGELNAIGNSEGRIFIGSSQDDFWEGIMVEDSGTTALAYVEICDAVNGIQYFNSDNSIDYCIIRSNSNCGIYIEDLTEPIMINNCTLEDNSIGIEVMQSVMNIHGSKLSGNTDIGIRSHHSRSIVTECQFEDNYFGFWSNTHDSSEVVDCQFVSNSVSTYYREFSYIYLNNNTFSDNIIHLKIAHQHFQNRHNIHCEGNNFLSFITNAIRMESTPYTPEAIQLGVNYYNTIDTAAIEEMIWDWFDNPTCDTLLFIPFAVTPFE